MNLFFSSVVYLNVTDLKTYQVGWDTFCVKWSPHRAATSYRLKLSPADGTCTRKQTEPGVETSHPAAPQGLFVDKPSWNMALEIMDDNPCVPPLLSQPGTRGQEITVRGSETSHCFTGLSPEAEYGVTVFVQTPNLEGPGVPIKEQTSKL